MRVISLYWFAAQQQTSACRRQASGSFYSKFSVEWSELTPSFQNRQEVTVCSYHVTYAFQSESTLYICLNVKELLAWKRRDIWSLSDCNGTRTQNHLVRKRTFNHLTKWLTVGLWTKWFWVQVLLHSLKSTGSGLKIAETKQCLKNVNIRISLSNS